MVHFCTTATFQSATLSWCCTTYFLVSEQICHFPRWCCTSSVAVNWLDSQNHVNIIFGRGEGDNEYSAWESQSEQFYGHGELFRKCFLPIAIVCCCCCWWCNCISMWMILFAKLHFIIFSHDESVRGWSAVLDPLLFNHPTKHPPIHWTHISIDWQLAAYNLIRGINWPSMGTANSRRRQTQ